MKSSFNRFFKAVSLRIFKPWLHPQFIYKRTNIYKNEQNAISKCAIQFTTPIIENYKRNFSDALNNNNSIFRNNNCYEDDENKKYKNFIGDFFKNKLSDKEILDEVKTLLVAVS